MSKQQSILMMPREKQAGRRDQYHMAKNNQVTKIIKKVKEVKQLEIKAWIRARREWLAKQAERRSKELMQEANDLLQVREFDGRLFVCYDDIPIIDTCLLKEDLTVAVEAARKTYIDYRKSKGQWHRK